MNRRRLIQAGLGLGLLPVGMHAFAAGRLHWQEITFTGLGTVLSIRAAHSSKDALQHALQEAKQVVARIEDDMSLFRPSSALSRLNSKGVLLNPSQDLLHVLRLSQDIARRSQGAFDVTVQPLWLIYAQAQKEGRLPTALEVKQAQEKVGWQRLKVTSEQITLHDSGMGVSLNGIAQGFAADQVRASLQKNGVQHALINTGEWSSIGVAEERRAWTLGIADPRHADRWLAKVSMAGWSVATSADDQCAFSSDKQHHHIFNPHTGYSPADIASVTVAASTCAVADALTKVLFVNGYNRALQLAKAWRVHALVVHKNGQWQTSNHFPSARG